MPQNWRAASWQRNPQFNQAGLWQGHANPRGLQDCNQDFEEKVSPEKRSPRIHPIGSIDTILRLLFLGGLCVQFKRWHCDIAIWASVNPEQSPLFNCLIITCFEGNPMIDHEPGLSLIRAWHESYHDDRHDIWVPSGKQGENPPLMCGFNFSHTQHSIWWFPK